MQRETCRLQPGTPRRTVHRLRATLLSHFPAKPPAAGELGGGGVGALFATAARGEDRSGGQAAPAPVPRGRLSCPGAFWGPATATWTPLAAPTPFSSPHSFHLTPLTDHQWLLAAAPTRLGRHTLLSPDPQLQPPPTRAPPRGERPSCQGFLDVPNLPRCLLLPLFFPVL